MKGPNDNFVCKRSKRLAIVRPCVTRHSFILLLHLLLKKFRQLGHNLGSKFGRFVSNHQRTLCRIDRLDLLIRSRNLRIFFFERLQLCIFGLFSGKGIGLLKTGKRPRLFLDFFTIGHGRMQTCLKGIRKRRIQREVSSGCRSLGRRQKRILIFHLFFFSQRQT